MLNIDFARANVKSLIYDQAVLEGISTTFPQTDAILENGIVNGVTLDKNMRCGFFTCRKTAPELFQDAVF